jgi:hypothetical protein
MKVKVFDANDEEKVYLDTDLAEVKDLKNPFGILDRLVALQNETDYLHLGKKVHDFGITEISDSGIEADSKKSVYDSTLYTGRNSLLLGADDSADKPLKYGCVTVEGEDGEVQNTDMQVGFRAYMSGLMLDTGSEATNFFGGRHEAYLASLTVGRKRIRMRTATKGGGKVFASYRQLQAFLEKNQDHLRMFRTDDRNNVRYTYSVVSIGDGVKKSPVGQARVEEILEAINKPVEEPVIVDPIPVTVTPDNTQTEALARMKDLRLDNSVINNFKNGKLMMSETPAGILLWLDDEAVKAVQKVSAMGCTPYHIVKTQLLGRPVYDVLYVSNEPEEWEYERPNKEKALDSWCWMTDYQDLEHGQIQVSPVNGGLQRIG